MKTAFLYKELGDEIYMETAVGYVEHGYKIEENEVFILDKGIHGLVQAAQQYWENFIISMEKFGFVLSKADPCFMYRENKKGICMMSIYVDDNFMVGHKEALDEQLTKSNLHLT